MSRERRAHARIAVPINVRVVIGRQEQELSVRDISRRGIFLYTKQPPAGVGAVLTLKLALTAGIKPLSVQAEVIRIVMDGNRGVLGMAMRFVQQSLHQEEGLLDLLDRAMLGRGTKMRAYPRVYHLIDVVCRTRTQAQALMRDIGEGGLGLTLDRPLGENEEVTVEISRRGDAPLRLQGWAINCEAVPGHPGMYRAGLRFGRIPPNVRRDLQTYLKKLYRG
jgi:hypothetical protein